MKYKIAFYVSTISLLFICAILLGMLFLCFGVVLQEKENVSVRPIIGMTCGTGNNSSYGLIDGNCVSAIENAGGTLIAIPNNYDEKSLDDMIGLIDGLLLSGGVDVDPSYYGEKPEPKLGQVDINRDQVELYLTKKALSKNMPIFGICRGVQLLNVAGGGTLYQDIDTDLKNALKHLQDTPVWNGTQAINIESGSRLLDIMKLSTMQVNTFHHQAVKEVAFGFRASAIAHDGVIEGIEGINHRFVIGVQFHPELMWQNNPPITALFGAFVSEAMKYKQQK